MKRVFILSGLAVWLVACNANRSGSGGNPAQDSVTPAAEGKGYTNDVGKGGTTGGSTDPANGGGPQQLNNSGSQKKNSLGTLPNTDSAADRRTPAMQAAGSGKTKQR